MKTRLILMLTAALVLGSSGKLRAAWDFTATAIGGGSVDITTGTYNEGDTIVVTASPDPSGTNAFVKWTGDVTEAQKNEPVLRLTCSGAEDGAFNVTSTFGKAWYVATVEAGGSDTNDGLTLGTAFATLAKGIEAASAGEVVLVDAGNYNVSATLAVDKGITVRGLHGAEQTTVTRTAGTPTIELSHADAVVESLHFKKGYPTAVKITAGTCRKCIMSGSTYTAGSGLGVNLDGADGRLSQCIITNNVGSSSTSGAGLYIKYGIAENCLIAYNGSNGEGTGGGVFMSHGATVRNCTIVNNVSGSGGVYAARGAKLENCIVWDNVTQASVGQVVSSDRLGKPSFKNCYFPPLVAAENNAVFTDCIETNMPPNFRDPANGDFRLTLGSLCLDAGLVGSVAPGGLDLDGNNRLIGANVDLGAYEFDPGEDLTCDIIAPQVEAIDTLDVTLAAAVTNAVPEAVLTYAWTLNEVAAGSDSTLALALTDPGYYTVGLTVDDGDATATTVRTNLLYVVPQTLYVTNVNAGATFPYATPETASMSIQSAIDASRDGCTILVAPGNYKISSTLEVSKGIELRSTEGPATTRLYRSGNVRLLYLAHAQARIAGLDFDTGYPRVIEIWANGGVISNCYIRNGYYTVGSGVGVYARSGLVTHSQISDNTCSDDRNIYGVGVFLEGNAVVENCLIRNNTSPKAKVWGGGVYLTSASAVIRNCTIVANKATNGGGVYAVNGTVENCIIVDNEITGTPGAGDPDWYAGASATFRNTCTPIDVGTNCVTAAPGFIDAGAGDYRITADSPCFNAGIKRESMIGATDYFGNPRIAGATVDIGFHEVVPPPGTMISIR